MKNSSILFVALLFLVGCSNENRSLSPDETRDQKEAATDTETRDSFPVISDGERVTLSEHVVAGTHTVFKFTADWWPICQKIVPQLEDIARNNPGLAVRYIDVTDMKQKSLPVVAQYNVQGTPDFVLFGPDGQRTGRGMEVWRTIKQRWGNSSG